MTLLRLHTSVWLRIVHNVPRKHFFKFSAISEAFTRKSTDGEFRPNDCMVHIFIWITCLEELKTYFLCSNSCIMSATLQLSYLEQAYYAYLFALTRNVSSRISSNFEALYDLKYFNSFCWKSAFSLQCEEFIPVGFVISFMCHVLIY